MLIIVALLIFSVLLLLLLLYVFPLGLTIKGKLITVFVSSIFAVLSVLGVGYLSAWQLITVTILLLVIYTYFFGKRLNSLVFVKSYTQAGNFGKDGGSSMRPAIIPGVNAANSMVQDDQLDIKEDSMNEMKLHSSNLELPKENLNKEIDTQVIEFENDSLEEYEIEPLSFEQNTTYVKPSADFDDYVSPLNELFEEEIKQEVAAK